MLQVDAACTIICEFDIGASTNTMLSIKTEAIRKIFISHRSIPGKIPKDPNQILFKPLLAAGGNHQHRTDKQNTHHCNSDRARV